MCCILNPRVLNKKTTKDTTAKFEKCFYLEFKHKTANSVTPDEVAQYDSSFA